MPRLRSPENVIDEIKLAIQRFHPKSLDFADDTFTFPKLRTIKICDLMIDSGIKLRWTALSRVTEVDQHLFYKMKEAGCVRVSFGIESGNPELLKVIKKAITINDVEQAVKLAKKAGLATVGFYIIGHPYETPQTIQDTIDLAAKLNTTKVSFSIMVPYPGTELYEMAKRGEGGCKIISENWEDYDLQLGNAMELEGLSRKKLESWHVRAYLTFYLRNHRLLDLTRLALSQRKLLWKIIKKRGGI